MATEIPGQKLTGIAAEALTQYTFVAATSGAASSTVSTAGTGAGRLLGVAQASAASGAAVEIMVTGQSKVLAAGAMAAGVGVTIDADGKATPATYDAGTAVVGISQSAATAEDQLVSVLLGSYKA